MSLPEATKKTFLRTWPGKIVLGAAGLLAVAFIGIQFIPVNRANPAVAAPIQWDLPQTAALAQRACMDCHSDETTWPLYSYVAPASWLIYYDVQRGRSELNFSTLLAAAGESQPATGSAAAPDFQAQSNRTGDLAYQFGQFLATGGQRRRGPGGFGGEGNGAFPRQGTGTAQLPQSQGAFPGGFDRNPTGRIAEEIQRNQMPPANYVLIHPAAKLSDAEKQQLIDGLTKTLSQSGQ